MGTTPKRKLKKEMVRVAHNLPNEAKVDLRSHRSDYDKELAKLASLAVSIYKKAPFDYHRDSSGNFVAARLVAVILDGFSNGSLSKSKYRYCGEKNVKRSVKIAFESGQLNPFKK